MFMILILITCLLTKSDITTAQDGKGANARSTDVSVGCFSGDSLVKLINGEQKQMNYLQTGDEILSVHHLTTVHDEMFLMLDKEPFKQARFYTFNTASGHRLSLTGLHLIPIVSSNGTFDYIPAKDVQLNDQFYVLVNEQFQSSPVINITIEIKRGYFAPLTMTGTILVNEIFVSCFASVKNHQFAQIFLTPFRWYYQFTRLISTIEPFDNNTRPAGIHWLIKIIYQFVNYIQPSTLKH